jgi:hypothetical protein
MSEKCLWQLAVRFNQGRRTEDDRHFKQTKPSAYVPQGWILKKSRLGALPGSDENDPNEDN